jgi:hypothetical protein
MPDSILKLMRMLRKVVIAGFASIQMKYSVLDIAKVVIIITGDYLKIWNFFNNVR